MIRRLKLAFCLVLLALPTAGLSAAELSKSALAGLTQAGQSGDLGPVEWLLVSHGGEMVYQGAFDAQDTGDRARDLLNLGEIRLASGDPMGHGEGGNDVWSGSDWPFGDGDVESVWLDDDSGGRVLVFPKLEIVTVVTVDPKRAGDLPRVVEAVVTDYVLEAVE
jgi:hypothetical protein